MTDENHVSLGIKCETIKMESLETAKEKDLFKEIFRS